jgi:hypothetical protein
MFSDFGNAYYTRTTINSKSQRFSKPRLRPLVPKLFPQNPSHA